MVEYVIDKIENGDYYYRYYADGNKDDYGICVFRKDGSREIVKRLKIEHKAIYGSAVLGKARVGKDHGMIAWG